MVRLGALIITGCCVTGLLATGPNSLLAAKDQSRIDGGGIKPDGSFRIPDPSPPPAPDHSPRGNEDQIPYEPIEPDDVPHVDTIELTIEVAKRAIDAFAKVNRRYDDKGLDQFETLEEFVKETDAGKQMESEIKMFGFTDISQWNAAISTVVFAYSALAFDQETEIKQQIDEIRKQTSLSNDERDKMVRSLEAMLPSDNNKKIVRDLMNDPDYAERLKLLSQDE